MPPDLKSVPTYIGIKGGGFICLYLDNALAVGVDTRVMEQLRERWLRNMGPDPWFNFAIKPGSLHYRPGKSLIAKDEDTDGSGVDPIEYLGAAMYFRRDRNGTPRFYWRQCKKKLLAWSEEQHPTFERNGPERPEPKVSQEELSSQGWWTPREIASITGKILWRRSLSLQPQCKVADIIAILRRASKERAIMTWDGRCFELSSAEAQTLTTAWSMTLANAENNLADRYAAGKQVFLATDASDNFWGELFFDITGRLVPGTEVSHARFPDDEKNFLDLTVVGMDGIGVLGMPR